MMRILVVGAGVAGLSAVRALTAAGHRVTIAERAMGPTALGTGLLLQPQAVRDLAQIGVDARALSFPLSSLRVLGLRGWPYGAAPRARGGGERRGCLRPDLHRALAAGIERRVQVRWGTEVRHVAEEGAQVTCLLGEAQEAFDIVIGADGLRSAVRGCVRPAGDLRYAGLVCWRTVVDVGCGSSGVERWGSATRHGVIPVAEHRSYVYATRCSPRGGAGGGWPGGPGLDPSDPAAAALAAAARMPAAAVLRHDLAEVDRVCFGSGRRVFLIGDAAHAMMPNLGAGAAAAIADSLALARALGGGIDGAGRRYRAQRAPAVELLRLAARTLGRLAHAPIPPARKVTDR